MTPNDEHTADEGISRGPRCCMDRAALAADLSVGPSMALRLSWMPWTLTSKMSWLCTAISLLLVFVPLQPRLLVGWAQPSPCVKTFGRLRTRRPVPHGSRTRVRGRCNLTTHDPAD